MFDSWGDGWQGNTWHWIDSNGVDTTGTLASGSSGTAELCIPADEGCYTFYVDTAGSFTSEVSWTLTDSAGATVKSGGADNIQHQVCPPIPTLAPTAGSCATMADGSACETSSVTRGSCDNGICKGMVKDTSSFEGGLDGWSTGVVGDQPFIIRQGGTPSAGTGPGGAADGTSYVYAETSAPNFNVNFDLEKTFPADNYLYGIAFQYHMYGATIGTAILESSADGTSWASLWSKSGEQGNAWKQATVYASSGQTMLRYT